MLLPVNASMLEACVLSVLSREDTYGYKLTQALTEKTGVSESSLYPVLRRLQKNGALTTYDENFSGRNRRYYQLSAEGRSLLHAYRREWREYKRSIDELLWEEGCEKCQPTEMDGGDPA
ncbi:MAG: PadR family transcriptional regulator [Christensenellaceae bacterium]|nr:PadR family transcriptional regulator [Christensenellaceae bacterium]